MSKRVANSKATKARNKRTRLGWRKRQVRDAVRRQIEADRIATITGERTDAAPAGFIELVKAKARGLFRGR